MNDKEIREAVDYYTNIGKLPAVQQLDVDLHKKYRDTFMALATLYLNASEEFPKEMSEKLSTTEEPSIAIHIQGFNLARSQCLAVHMRVVAEYKEELDKWVSTVEYANEELRVTRAKVGELEEQIKTKTEVFNLQNLAFGVLEKREKNLLEAINKLKEENAQMKKDFITVEKIDSAYQKLLTENEQLHKQIEGLRAQLKSKGLRGLDQALNEGDGIYRP